MAERPKESSISWIKSEEAKKHSISNLSFYFFFFCFSLSSPSIHPLIQPSLHTPLPFGLTMYLVLGVLSWLCTSEYMTCWFIVKLCQFTPAAVEINYSDPVGMTLEDVCRSVFVCVWTYSEVVDDCLLSQQANSASTAENGVVCTLLTKQCRPRGLILCSWFPEKGNKSEGNEE